MSEKLKIFDKNTLQKVEQRVAEMQSEGDIDFPPNYSPQNAIKSTWLQLQSITDKNDDPVLESCSKSSIMESMLDIVIQGLSPSKNQVYLIPYGKQLNAQRSYFGDMALAKRVDNVKEIRASIIYEDDEIEIDKIDGRTVITDHETSWENRQNDIAGAYTVIVFGDDRPDRYTIMTKDEIEQSWDQSRMNNSYTQNDFPGEMAKRTVVRRACKTIINSSDDASLLKGKPEFNKEQTHERQVEAEKQEEANKEVVDLEPTDQEIDAPESKETEENLDDEKSEEKQEKLIDDEESDIEKQPDF